MIRVLIRTAYPPHLGLPSDTLDFELWSGYGCRTALEAHELLTRLFSTGDHVEVIDESGDEPWLFWPETVAAFLVIERRIVAR